MARPRKNDAAATATANGDPSLSPSTAGASKLKPKRARKNRPTSQSQRSSAYRGVTRHRWTGRFEAHLWDKDHDEPQPQPQDKKKKKKKKGRQVYLGAYDDEDAAARAFDLAALKYWGPGTVLNFPLCNYEEELREMEGQSREEYVGSVRRKSSGFSRGVSKYRGVARHHHNGRWEARIGRVLGNKYLYLGTYATQEEAAVAYDVAAIEHRGLNAVTNFDIAHYVNWHRRWRRLLGEESLLLDDATGMSPNPPLQADAAFHDGNELPDDDDRVLVRDAPPPAALDMLLLLQSPKFTEIMEQAVSSAAAAVTTTESNGNSSPSPCSASSSSSSSRSPSEPSQERQPDEELTISGGASSSVATRCGFPDDVQTYYEWDIDDGLFAPPASALDMLLLQSPKFTEIMEQAVSSAAAVTTTTTESSTGSPSPCSTSSSSMLPSEPSPERQPPEELSGDTSSVAAARYGFPDDVQTYFEWDVVDDGMNFALADEVDTFLFGDLGSYAAPMFHCDDLDVFLGPEYSVE